MLSLYVTSYILGLLALFAFPGVAMREGRVIQVLEDDIGAENFTYYRLQRDGMMSLELVSLQGDVDMYLSTEVQHPDYDTYDLKSDSCGTDTIIVPSSMQRPVYISLFGHPNHIKSKYRLTILEHQETFVEDYEYLVNKYERYYYEEMQQATSGSPKPPAQKSEALRDRQSIADEEEDPTPLWWNILLGILQFGVEVIL